jgi:hypothetical protein
MAAWCGRQQRRRVRDREAVHRDHEFNGLDLPQRLHAPQDVKQAP